MPDKRKLKQSFQKKQEERLLKVQSGQIYQKIQNKSQERLLEAQLVQIPKTKKRNLQVFFFEMKGDMEDAFISSAAAVSCHQMEYDALIQSEKALQKRPISTYSRNKEMIYF